VWPRRRRMRVRIVLQCGRLRVRIVLQCGRLRVQIVLRCVRLRRTPLPWPRRLARRRLLPPLLPRLRLRR
jgi:hypothetical protein